jgi:hypothetical protein
MHVGKCKSGDPDHRVATGAAAISIIERDDACEFRVDTKIDPKAGNIQLFQ